MTIPSLQALLAPHDPEAFHSAVRERRRVFIRTGNGDQFQRLLPWSAFNGMLTPERLLDDQTRILRRGRDLPREMWSYVDPKLKRVVLPEQLQQFCHEGLSLSLNQVHLAKPAIAALVAMLEHALPARIQTNLYASFGRESAFRAHRDPHDVLILHLHGRKRWFCYGPCPAKTNSAVIPDERLPPLQCEQVLEPGDILYIPRGDVHRASVESEASLHLTHSLLWPRGSDLLQWVAGNGMEGADFDPDIPVYGSDADLDRYEQELRAALHRLAETVDVKSFLMAFGQERRLRLPFNLGLSAELTPDCWVRPVPFPGMSLPAEGEAVIPFNGGSAKLDPQERAVLAALLAQGARRIADLPDMVGQDMETVRNTVSGLARRSLVLLTEG